MDVTVTARLNHGRWIADCPMCGGAEIVKPGKAFVCGGRVRTGFHGETTTCGFIAAVAWPADKLAIEHLLERRQPFNQNWEPGETLEQLRDDNIAHGLIAGVLLAR